MPMPHSFISIRNEKDRKNDLPDLIDEISQYLPMQGPLSNFIHQNALKYFESLPFFEGVELAGEIFGANAYLSEKEYQQAFNKGRITPSDLNRALKDLKINNEPWIGDLSKRKFIRSLMLTAPAPITKESLRWRLFEKGYLDHFNSEIREEKRKKLIKKDLDNLKSPDLHSRLEALKVPHGWKEIWPKLILNLIHNTAKDELDTIWEEKQSVELLWMASATLALELFTMDLKSKSKRETDYIIPFNEPLSKIEELITPYLIKFTSAFLDIGLAHLHVSEREKGLLSAFLNHMKNDSHARPAWFHGDFSSYHDLTNFEIIEKILKERAIEAQSWGPYLLRKSLLLRGWGGLIHQIEKGKSGLEVSANFADFLAIRLLLENVVKSNTNFDISNLSESTTFEQFLEDNTSLLKAKAFHLFQAFQIFGLSGSEVFNLLESDKMSLCEVALQFDQRTRLRIWHKAYEWNLYSRVSSSITSRGIPTFPDTPSYKTQIVCCLDDREESFRRYIEEISPEYETFGTAGFFGVDAEFHSLYERPAPFCPINVNPTHKVSMVARKGSEHKMTGLGTLKQLQSEFLIFLEGQSRSLFRGWLIALGGVLALVPLSIATLSPRWTHKLKRYLKKILVNPQDESAIVYAEDDSNENEGKYTLEEMCFRVRMLLESTGMIKSIAPLIIIMGHGSFSTNNPYRSAYDCAACGGRPGRLNPRVFALMANRQDVRDALKNENFIIPENTHFVGAFHNTCTDEVEYFDTDLIPDKLLKLFSRLKSDIELARSRNALERCRRFDETHIHNEKEAIAHVESRAHHIAQPRPEYGHATNAFAIIGRRDLSRNLFLDRRAFLISYDHTIDPNRNSLKSILRAAVPVGMGINLDYYFSAIDNQRYGAGSKLPLNITSLLGLMTGYCSDLRTGLPSQMVEIHEPVRLLVIIELDPQEILKILPDLPEVETLIVNRWVQVMAYKSESNEIFFFNEHNKFEKIDEPSISLRTVPSSLSWFLNKTEHLEFVEIKPQYN